MREICTLKYAYSANNNTNLDNLLELFQKNGEKILELKKTEDELLRYVYDSVVNLMEIKGFETDGNRRNKTSLTSFFYVSKDSKTSIINKNKLEIARKFRLWVNLEPTLYDNFFRIIFELWDKKNTVLGDSLKKALRKKNIFTDKVRLGEKGSSNQSYQHIYDIRIPFKRLPNESFSKTLEKVVNKEFFQKDYIHIAIEELEKLENIIQAE